MLKQIIEEVVQYFIAQGYHAQGFDSAFRIYLKEKR